MPAKPATAPEGGRLVSCCPGLQHLDMRWLQYNADVLGPLPGLSSLCTVLLSPVNVTKGLEVVGQLPQLRHLVLHASGVDAPKGLLLHVTHLKQLTYLDYDGILNRQYTVLKLEQQVHLYIHGHLGCTSGTVAPAVLHLMQVACWMVSA
mgnify:CR=1 FL=1